MTTKYLVPFENFRRSMFHNPLTDEMDRLFDNLATSFGSNIKSTGKNLVPKVNVYKKDGKYHIDAFVPMATKDDIDVEINENVLSIAVKSRQDKEVSDDDYIIREVSRGQMTRMFSLGEDINVDSAKSSFKDGVLAIEFDAKQVEETKTKKLTIS